MDVSDLKGLTAEVKKRMDAQIDHVRRELGTVRTGRASVGILDVVHVEAYGSSMPLNQVASLSIPEPTLILAQPFDPALAGAIEKAIRAANLGLNPANDGKAIRIPVPALTEERRKELTKVVRHEGESTRVAVRNLRRDANAHLKELLKKHAIPEDQERRTQEEVQKLTDRYIAEIDKLLQQKEADLMHV